MMRRARTAATGEAKRYRGKAKDGFDGRCDRCGMEIDWEDVEVHHVDRDRNNDNDDNLERLCWECHKQEHYGDDPLWGMVVSMPRPVIELLDEAVERHGYRSRSEAVVRAITDTYEQEGGGFFGGAEESVSCWFTDDRHTKWVSDAVVPPEGNDE